ncbi:GGDEF domain-containing protein [Amycolatopsis sp. H20-H5]|uniref:GGDEF domain-containing protein n=1 Tax=Amycolatopsis sp. H20-H5 TaxID=3046309 RepID=UPI002DBF9AA9|nr:GGDEF domain-containing protein [Amycolatopsis sp. H20-H5]MEC3978326.1 GGDEF domain-containing protein [Amycolatopsis sp. H20-H5]
MAGGAKPVRPRRWPLPALRGWALWQLPRPGLAGYVLAVDLAALAGTAAFFVTSPVGSTDVFPSVVLVVGLVLGRFGGEEFVVLLPNTTGHHALAIAERIRGSVAAITVPTGGDLLQSVTVSIGVATHPAHGDSLDEVLEAADHALYQAKTDGRNRTREARRAGLLEQSSTDRLGQN